MQDSFVSVLFHYTMDISLQAILATGELLPSLVGANTRDVRYGQGQYLADVLPGSMTGAQLSRLLLGHPFQGSRFSHYLALDVTGLSVLQGRSRVFVIHNTSPLRLQGRIVSTGRNTP